MSTAAGREGWTLALVAIQLVLTIVLCTCLALWWFGHEREQNRQRERLEREAGRVHRNLIWEVNRHGQILLREGLAKPGDQLGLPEEIPTQEDPTLGDDHE